MKIVLLTICAVFFALGCGPKGLPVSDISSYKLDYYDYAKNRLPIEEKIVEGQCMICLQPATNAMFADYENEQDSANAKTRFVGALRECGEKILIFAERIEDIRMMVWRDHQRLQKKLQTSQPVINEDTQQLWYAGQTLPLLAKAYSRLEAMYAVSQNLAGCLQKSVSESDETHCMEEASYTLEKVLPKE
jgi:hypothetical protein